jgi:hypothetical protein
MNGKKAKTLRKALGFHPGKEREYATGKPSFRLGNAIGQDGKRLPFAVTGTIKCTTGARSSYQIVKRDPALTRMVLAAPKLESAHG